MIILIDKSTRVSLVLSSLLKEYEGVMVLHSPVSKESLESVIENFKGKITQVPPRRSAVSRKPRTRKIVSLEVTGFSRKKVYFRVVCEAGTYIRKLCHDIGVALGSGAHLQDLRRTRIGNFHISEAVSLQEFEKSKTPERYLVPVESVLEKAGIEKLVIKEGVIKKIKNGTPLDYSDVLTKFSARPERFVCIYDTNNGVVALGKTREKSGGKKVVLIERVLL